MLNQTLSRLRCPRCKRSLNLELKNPSQIRGSDSIFDIRYGTLICAPCRARFPILEGVAVLVKDVRFYLLSHVKGISKLVPDSEIPKEYRSEYLQAQEEIQEEHIEEDLEAERVNALYLMNHYLRVQKSSDDLHPSWWKPSKEEGSPLMDSLVREYWDQGPFSQIERWVSQLKGASRKGVDLVELGCGVGGLYRQLQSSLSSYLGVDSSFASIALCRHLALGGPYRGTLRIPEDLLQGPVSREVKIPVHQCKGGDVDFIVGDLENLPLQSGQWDVSVALNTIDMLNDPIKLPQLQSELLKKGGIAIQSCPYIWHESIARKLRKKLPSEISTSARAVEWLYQKAGFQLKEKLDHLPWLFFKHARQLEIYSVHLFLAQKAMTRKLSN